MNTSSDILALVTECFGGRGGIAQYNRDLLSALACAEAAGSIAILPRSASDAVKTENEQVRNLPPQPGRFLYSLAALRTALTRRFGIVFCGHLHMAPLAALIARLTGAKLVVQMHGIEAWPRPSGSVRAATESADLILCVSRHTRSKVLEWAILAPERVLVLPNTFSEDFSPGESELRVKLGLEDKRVLLTVGRLDSREAYKGHDRVIAVVPSLVARGLDIVYVIVGEGNDRRRLEGLAAEIGVADRVRFLGAVNHQTLKEAYRMADLYVMPSTGEGFGIAYLEAMASGTPALGLDVAGACDALADGELGGCVVEPDLEEAIAEQLLQPETDSKALARAVDARFGHAAFQTRAQAILDRLKVAS